MTLIETSILALPIVSPARAVTMPGIKLLIEFAEVNGAHRPEASDESTL
jgi:hypothetical protein